MKEEGGLQAARAGGGLGQPLRWRALPMLSASSSSASFPLLSFAIPPSAVFYLFATTRPPSESGGSSHVNWPAALVQVPASPLSAYGAVRGANACQVFFCACFRAARKRNVPALSGATVMGTLKHQLAGQDASAAGQATSLGLWVLLNVRMQAYAAPYSQIRCFEVSRAAFYKWSTSPNKMFVDIRCSGRLMFHSCKKIDRRAGSVLV